MPDDSDNPIAQLCFPTVWVPCAECDLPIILPKYFLAMRKQDGKDFFCPNGHPQSFDWDVVTAGAAKMERELRRLKVRALHEIEQAEARAAELRTLKGEGPA